MPDTFVVSRCAPHLWEEPCISGARGSGTIFFAGCNLRCVFCQNREISHEGYGREVSAEKLAQMMLRLQDEGVHNINLVTPTHYAEQLIPVLQYVRPRLSVPVVYNCGGYEDAGTMKQLRGLIDIYMPDFKYYSDDLSKRYSGAADYREVASLAVREMYAQAGDPVTDEATGLLKKGLIIRHLVLPGHRQDSINVLRLLKELLPKSSFILSLMSQYTPDFVTEDADECLHRHLTTFEYRTVCEEASALGLDGYMQDSSSADRNFTPDFHEITF